tara:strand:- start:2116 stop:2412 length:297 start_codon:yes stop_codon:yes gene_type:complete
MTIPRILPALALSSIVLLSSCNDPSIPRTGEYVTVQFRRDALGVSHGLPVSPTVDSMNGASVNLRGKLLAVDKNWVVVKDDANTHWIARPSILLLTQP